eukprot:COSAG01_NODE_1024_length_12058_cov_91.598211_2_plen_294_part_00
MSSAAAPLPPPAASRPTCQCRAGVSGCLACASAARVRGGGAKAPRPSRQPNGQRQSKGGRGGRWGTWRVSLSRRRRRIAASSQHRSSAGFAAQQPQKESKTENSCGSAPFHQPRAATATHTLPVHCARCCWRCHTVLPALPRSALYTVHSAAVLCPWRGRCGTGAAASFGRRRSTPTTSTTAACVSTRGSRSGHACSSTTCRLRARRLARRCTWTRATDLLPHRASPSSHRWASTPSPPSATTWATGQRRRRPRRHRRRRPPVQHQGCIGRPPQCTRSSRSCSARSSWGRWGS